jgi:hypothetical protein
MQRSGALDRHPRYPEAVMEYEAWLASLLPSDRGTPGQRNWRLRCVAKACEILSAKTGRATGNAVLRMIGFGSSTDVSVDVREWIEREAPRKADLLQISPLLKSEALRDAVNNALMQILGSAQQEARTAASEELQGERASLEAERIQSQLEVSRALAARDAAMDTAAAMERERDQHAPARQHTRMRGTGPVRRRGCCCSSARTRPRSLVLSTALAPRVVDAARRGVPALGGRSSGTPPRKAPVLATARQRAPVPPRCWPAAAGRNDPCADTSAPEGCRHNL